MELMLLTASFYFLRTKTNTPPCTRVGELQEHKFRQRAPHGTQWPGQAAAPVPTDPVLSCPGLVSWAPFPAGALRSSLPELLIAPSDTQVTCSSRDASTHFYPLVSSWGGVGMHSPVSWRPTPPQGGGFLGQGPVWFLVHRVSPNPRVC